MAGCNGTGKRIGAGETKLASSTRGIVGTSLIGAKGATRKDQTKIDTTAVRLCETSVWTPSECVRHGKNSKK